MVVRELLTDRRLRRLRQADLAERVPELPPQLASEQGPLLVLEESYPDAWWQPGRPSRLVVTTGALRRLTNPQVEAVLAHERNHARAGHPWLLRLAAALGNGFPHVPLFRHFCDQTHRLVEYAADDAASRGHGHLTTGLALIELNQHRGVLSCASTRTLLGTRVDRLLDPQPRVEPLPRALATVGAALGPLTPVLITFAPAVAVLR